MFKYFEDGLDYFMSLPSKKTVVICIFLLLIFNEFSFAYVDKNPPLSSTTTNALRILNLFIIILMFSAKSIAVSLRDIVIIFNISLLLLIIINFVFVYNSPKLISLMPKDFTRYVSSCYRTLFHLENENFSKINFVFGDSFSEGAGDEYLTNDLQYGIFKKLDDLEETELIFGRGGYGNKSTIIEFERCFPLLTTFTNLPSNLKNKYSVTFVFFEGNDLYNNLNEIKREYSRITYKLKFFFPIMDYFVNKTVAIYSFLTEKKIRRVDNRSLYPVTETGIKYGYFPSSASTELTNNEILKSLAVFQNSLKRIKKVLPRAKDYRLLYIPSDTSAYKFKSAVKVKSYKRSNNKFYETTAEFNLKRSLYIRKFLIEFSQNHQWNYCDTTSSLLNVTNLGIAVNGPIDWGHLNKLGYSIVANAYKDCFFINRN